DAFPARRAAQGAGARAGRRGGPAHRGQEGLHRHLLHRRTRFPRISVAIHPGAQRRDPRPARPGAGRTSRRVPFHPGAARRAPVGRRARARAGTLVRGRQGRGAERALRRPGPRQPVAAVHRTAQRNRALDRGWSPCAPLRMQRAGALPPGRGTLRGRSARRRHAAGAVRPRPACRDARPVRGPVQRRHLPRRRGDRLHQRPPSAFRSTHHTGTGCMSDTSMDNRMLALAGVAQALAQVRRIADTGQADAGVLATALDSVFRVDAASTEAVYGDATALRPGLLLLRSYFRNESGDALLPRLGLAVLQLERRFVRDEAADRVHRRILTLAPQAARDGSTHPDVLAALGALYADTVSKLRPRVMVQGNPHYLGQAGVVAEIRAVLLAALRSAVLWRQLGGSLWDFMLRRRQMLEAIQRNL